MWEDREFGVEKYAPLEPGQYKAKVGEVELVEGKFGERVQIKWFLTEPDFADRWVKSWCNPKLGTGGKKGPTTFYRIVSALLYGGRPLPEDHVFKLKDLLEREAVLTIGVNDKDFNDVLAFAPVRRSAPVQNARPAAVQARPAAEPDDWPEPDFDNMPVPAETDSVPF